MVKINKFKRQSFPLLILLLSWIFLFSTSSDNARLDRRYLICVCCGSWRSRDQIYHRLHIWRIRANGTAVIGVMVGHTHFQIQRVTREKPGHMTILNARRLRICTNKQIPSSHTTTTYQPDSVFTQSLNRPTTYTILRSVLPVFIPHTTVCIP